MGPVTPRAQAAPAPAGAANVNNFQYLKGISGVFRLLLSTLETGSVPGVGHSAGQAGGAASGQQKERRPRLAHAGGRRSGSALDPLMRSLATAALVHPGGDVAPARLRVGTSVPAVDVAVVEALVQRVAWGGDRRRGVARIELGGPYAGTCIVVESSGRDLALRVEGPAESELRGLCDRIRERLRGRGLTLHDEAF